MNLFNMAEEMIDIYDESNNFTGIQKMKSEVHKDGMWHRNAHIMNFITFIF